MTLLQSDKVPEPPIELEVSFITLTTIKNVIYMISLEFHPTKIAC